MARCGVFFGAVLGVRALRFVSIVWRHEHGLWGAIGLSEWGQLLAGRRRHDERVATRRTPSTVIRLFNFGVFLNPDDPT